MIGKSKALFLTMSLYILDHNQFLDKVPQALSFICKYIKEDMKTWTC
jgi:hypothetical protein